MKSTITVSVDSDIFKVIYALMEQRGISRSEALNFLALQGVLRLKELNEEAEIKRIAPLEMERHTEAEE